MNPLSILPLVLCFAAPAWAAPGVMIRDEDMKASASATGVVVGQAPKGAGVEILARQGGWTRISSAGKTGWVRILTVKSTAPSASAGDVLGLVEAGTARREPGQVVAVAGLRGLTEEQLRSARFSASELMQMDGYRSNKADTREYARSVGLHPVGLAYLPNPEKARKPERGHEDAWGPGS